MRRTVAVPPKNLKMMKELEIKLLKQASGDGFVSCLRDAHEKQINSQRRDVNPQSESSPVRRCMGLLLMMARSLPEDGSPKAKKRTLKVEEGYSDTSEQDDGVLADTVNLNSIPSKPSAAATRRRAAESSQGLQAIQKMEQNYGHERNCPPKQIVLAQEGRDASNSLDQKISYLGGVRHGLGYDLHVSPDGPLDSDALADSDGSEDVLSALEAEGGASEESPGLGARSDGDDDGHGHDSSASVSSERSTAPEGMTGPTPQPPEEHQESRLRRKFTLRSVSAARMEHEERVEQWKQLLTSLGKDKEEQLDQAIWDRRRPFIEAFCLSKRGLRLGFEETLQHLVRTAYMQDVRTCRMSWAT